MEQLYTKSPTFRAAMDRRLAEASPFNIVLGKVPPNTYGNITENRDLMMLGEEFVDHERFAEMFVHESGYWLNAFRDPSARGLIGINEKWIAQVLFEARLNPERLVRDSGIYSGVNELIPLGSFNFDDDEGEEADEATPPPNEGN